MSTDDGIDGRTIGQLATDCGIGVETVRYYERRGLIERPARPPQGSRRYPPSTARRIRFIRRAQTLGFSLDEIQALLQIDAGHCADVQALAADKLTDIRQRIGDLQQLADRLQDWMQRCQSTTADQHCPLIEALQDSDDPT